MLTNNQQEKVVDALRKGRFASAQLQEKIEKGTLDEEMKGTFATLLECYLVEVHQGLDYESELVKEQDKRYVEIRQALRKVETLEEELASKNPLSGFKEQFNLIKNIVHDWWRKEGFVYVEEVKIVHFGSIEVKFGFMLDSRTGMFAKDKEASRTDDERHFHSLKERGFTFCEDAKERFVQNSLQGTAENERLLLELIQNRFPSFELLEMDKQQMLGHPIIMSARGRINEISDLDNDKN